jgi:hypothetical protein
VLILFTQVIHIKLSDSGYLSAYAHSFESQKNSPAPATQHPIDHLKQQVENTMMGFFVKIDIAGENEPESAYQAT